MARPLVAPDGQRVLHAELRVEQVADLGTVELHAHLLVAVNDHAARWSLAFAPVSCIDLEQRIEAGVQAAAAGVGLHAGARDAEFRAEAVQASPRAWRCRAT